MMSRTVRAGASLKAMNECMSRTVRAGASLKAMNEC